MYKRTAGASTSGTGSATASATTSGSGSTITGGFNANSTSPVASGSVTATASQTAGMNHTVIANQTSSATQVASASKTASITTSAPGPIYTDITDSSEWYSLGCAIDEGGRVLTDYYVAQDDMAIDLCLDICEDKGYKYAGLENGNECMCGNALKQGVSYTASEWDCWMPCAGDATETCGAGWRLMTYELATGIDYCEDTISSSLASSTSARTSLIVNNHAASTKAASPSNASTIASASASIKPSASVSSAAISKTSTAAASTATGAVVKGSTTIPSSSADHEVFAHHMVGNTYPYVQSTWATDIKLAKAASIDGFALNMGSDWWQPLRVNDAYAAAEAAGDFTMFLSLDMTSLSCSSYTDGIVLASLVKAHASSPAQAMWNGKVLVSTFSGENCYFGQGSVSDGWNNVFIGLLKSSGIDIFFVPSVFSDPSSFSAATWMDGELNWNGGWPMDGSDITTSSDATYMNALGSKEYMAAISPAFFTHFPVNGWNKNWIYRGDNWLYSKRWEDVIAMRDRVKMVEILTWNDYGEASYIGPIDGALPSGSEAWTNGFPHTAWLQLTKYYAQAFKTGSWPTITSDSIVVWARPHPKAATASNDSIGRPSGWDRTDDDMYALVFATDSGTVTLTAGSNTQIYPVTKGVNKLKLASSPGSMSAKLVRNGQTVTSYDAGSAYTYTLTPTTYNFNYFVGSSS
jgi:glucan endo-1,3-alpha-glucosidase